jgi:hypothetical protein
VARNDANARLYVTLAVRWMHGGRASLQPTATSSALRNRDVGVPTTMAMIMLAITATADTFGETSADGRVEARD